MALLHKSDTADCSVHPSSGVETARRERNKVHAVEQQMVLLPTWAQLGHRPRGVEGIKRLSRMANRIAAPDVDRV